MNRLSRITLFAQIIYFTIGGLTQATEATKVQIVNGMTLAILEGPYQYKSGGVPLYGYIITINIPSKYQATDKVKFDVCKTGKELSVNYGDLIHVKQGCGTSGRTWPETTASWPEWKINSGKLVADQKAKWPQIDPNVLSLKDILISDLPVAYQSALLPEKQGKTVAVTVRTDDGSLLLGILPERKTDNGS
jgi:hypothetical protein